MIINKDCYECPECREIYDFDTSQSYTAMCPNCRCRLKFLFNADCDMDKELPPPYDVTKDPKSPFYVPRVEGLYCHSSNTKKISGLSKAGSVALWGVLAAGKVGKQWHCNSCGSDF